MITEYISAAMGAAKYEIIEDEEKFYGSIPALKGVWATGKTLEVCRKNLASVLEGWIIIRISKGLQMPSMNGITIKPGKKLETYV